MTRVVLAPGVLALLPEYAGLVDPVADLRAACRTAVGRLGSSVTVCASSPQGERVASSLLDSVTRTDEVPSVLLVGNGSARRTEKAPGHLDERAAGFDRDLRAWLGGAAPPPDPALARELWADVDALLSFDRAFTDPEVLYDDDPFGVQYWVLSWDFGDGGFEARR